MSSRLSTVAVATLLSACAAMPHQVLSPAVGVPGRFMVLDKATGAQARVDPGAACESPLVDPRDGTVLVMVRASDGQGDYRPATPAYGLDDGQLLRIDCTTGVAVGVVSR